MNVSQITIGKSTRPKKSKNHFECGFLLESLKFAYADELKARDWNHAKIINQEKMQHEHI